MVLDAQQRDARAAVAHQVADLHGEMWGDVGRYGELQADMGRYGEMWGDMSRAVGEVAVCVAQARYGGDMGRYGEI